VLLRRYITSLFQGYHGNINMISTSSEPGRKAHKDCTLKGMVLRAVARHSNNATSREIFNSINYNNYRAFRVSLHHYVRNGYLRKCGDRKPYHYCLTKKGYLHANDPFVLKKRRELRYWQHMSRMLANEKEFMYGMSRFIQYQPEIALREISKSPYFKDDSSFHVYYKRIIETQSKEIRELQDILYRIGYRP